MYINNNDIMHILYVSIPEIFGIKQSSNEYNK